MYTYTLLEQCLSPRVLLTKASQMDKLTKLEIITYKQKVYLYQSLSCILFSISQRAQPFIFMFLLLVNIIYNSLNKSFFICILLKYYHQAKTIGIIIHCIFVQQILILVKFYLTLCFFCTSFFTVCDRGKPW